MIYLRFYLEAGESRTSFACAFSPFPGFFPSQNPPSPISTFVERGDGGRGAFPPLRLPPSRKAHKVITSPPRLFPNTPLFSAPSLVSASVGAHCQKVKKNIMSIAFLLPFFFAQTTSRKVFFFRRKKGDWEWLSISAPPSATANGVQKHWSNWKILARGSKSTSLLLFSPFSQPLAGNGGEGGRERPFRTH